MDVSLSSGGVADYKMVLGEQSVAMQPFIGRKIKLIFDGKIYCQACSSMTEKSFSRGFCFPCSQRLAQCDLCMMKPETCHFISGTCRDFKWGKEVCMKDHIVYLANSSGIKVGVTRIGQVPTRWIDQGATQTLPIFRTRSRYQSGLLEMVLKNHVSDKTNWRTMLRGVADPVDLIFMRNLLMCKFNDEIRILQQRFDESAITPLCEDIMLTIHYPVQFYPKIVRSLDFNEMSEIDGVLQGMKGQYLILNIGVVNIRKFSGYQITMIL
ncbi:MAG: DUF2797 domain-containing protein [Piscirickettsiaceae bacterium]|nr:DUF2797 domain-containing protein [Piscirickettsiaceae bacterium]